MPGPFHILDFMKRLGDDINPELRNDWFLTSVLRFIHSHPPMREPQNHYWIVDCLYIVKFFLWSKSIVRNLGEFHLLMTRTSKVILRLPELKGDRKLQTMTTRFISGHTRTLTYVNVQKEHPVCPKYNLCQWTPIHLLYCLGDWKRRIFMRILRLYETFCGWSVTWTWSSFESDRVE